MNIINPKKDECFNCHEKFERAWNLAKQDYSSKNDWYYWTENEENKGKLICNKCLLRLYNEDKRTYWASITNQVKRNTLRGYIRTGIIS
jgi:hypothetical protein